MYKFYNANPRGLRVGDCVIRALSKALNADWETTYIEIAVEGLINHDMPTSNAVWGSYLRLKGFTRQTMPHDCPDCYSVADFAADHPRGTHILALSGHVVCVKDGDWYDTWDSGAEPVLYSWERTD